MNEYDKKEFYNENIRSLIEQVDVICAEAHIPFFFTAAVSNEHGETQYENTARTPAPLEVALNDDKITEHVKVSAGFETILPETLPEIEL